MAEVNWWSVVGWPRQRVHYWLARACEPLLGRQDPPRPRRQTKPQQAAERHGSAPEGLLAVAEPPLAQRQARSHHPPGCASVHLFPRGFFTPAAAALRRAGLTHPRGAARL